MSDAIPRGPEPAAISLSIDAAVLATLCQRFGVRRLDVFGSAGTAAFDPARSDVDLLVEFEPLPPADYARAYFGLRAGLERLFGREIDLLTEPALINPYLRRQIAKDRRELFRSE